MADIRLEDYARQPGSPRVETLPSIDLMQVEYSVPAGGHTHIYQRTKTTAMPTSPSIIIATRPYLTWCLIVFTRMTMLLEVEGNDIIVVGGFVPTKAFPLFSGIQNELTRYYVPGFLARLTVYNPDIVARPIGGMIKIEGM